MKLQFWFEFASTYSYPAVMRVGKMAAARGVERPPYQQLAQRH